MKIAAPRVILCFYASVPSRTSTGIAMRRLRQVFLFASAAAFILSSAVNLQSGQAAEKQAAPASSDKSGGEWLQLIGPEGASGWQKVDSRMVFAGDAELAPGDPKKLVAKPGKGVLVAESKEQIPSLYTKKSFGDCELHLEFLVSKGSNSGIKFHGQYEIQIYDSFGVKKLTGSHCGGVYPHWKPGNGRLNYLDEGIAPKVNAAKPAGQWQTLDVLFRAPRFDAAGKKIQNAKLVLVKLNDQAIHENQEVDSPTGWVREDAKEFKEGQIMLQVDHGPVAFRNVRVRPCNLP